MHLKIDKKLTEIERKLPTRKTKSEGLRLDMAERVNNFQKQGFDTFISSLSQEDFICYPSKEEIDEFASVVASHFCVDSKDIIFGTGSDSSIRDIFLLVSKHSKNVVTTEPCFPMYDVYAKIFDLELRKVSYDSDMKIQLNDVADVIDENTGLIVLANPNSPIGDVYSEDFLRNLSSLCENRGAILLIDEAYAEFANCSLMQKLWSENVVFVKTLSKAYGSAGARIGFSVSKGSVNKCLNSLRQTFPLTGASLKWGKHIIKIYSETEDYVKGIVDELTALNLKLSSIAGLHYQIGNVNWFHVSHDDENFLNFLVEKHKISCRHDVKLPRSSLRWKRICISPGFHKCEFIYDLTRGSYGQGTTSS